jgi:hypothetical protein
MTPRNLADDELVNVINALTLLEDSDSIEIDKDLLIELVQRFEKVLISSPSPEKDPNQLEFDYLV